MCPLGAPIQVRRQKTAKVSKPFRHGRREEQGPGPRRTSPPCSPVHAAMSDETFTR